MTADNDAVWTHNHSDAPAMKDSRIASNRTRLKEIVTGEREYHVAMRGGRGDWRLAAA